MKFWSQASLQRKQTLVIMLTTTVALLLSCAGFMAYDTVTVRQGMVHRLETLAQVLGNNTTGALDFNDRGVAQEILSALRAEPEVVAACIYAKSGAVFATYPPGLMEAPLDGRFPPDSHRFEGQRLLLTRTITQGPDLLGLIRLEMKLDALSRRQRQYSVILGSVLLVSLLAAFGLSAWLQRLLSGPLLHLVRATRAVAQEKNYSVRVPKQREDELGSLIDDFNEMVAQIQTRDEALRQAHDELERRVAQRTHELRVEVAERKRAELEAEQQRDFAVQVMNVMGEGLTVTDETGRFAFVNPAFARMVGWRPEEVVGHAPADFACPEDLPKLAEQLRQRSAGQISTYEVRARRPDGSLIPIHITAVPRWRDGAVVGAIATVVDLTQRKRQEEALQRAKEAAEAANQAKSEFLAVMSHEIRTPMNAIMGMTNLLLLSPLNPEQTELARTVANSGEALLELINEILDFSKIESGEHFQLEDEIFSLRELLEGVVQLLRPRAEARNVSLKLDLDPGIAEWSRADAGRLRQVLVNLAGNGIKFTDEGHVTVRVRRLGGDGQVEQLRFEVEDTGIGISPENQGRLFQPFSQVDSSATRRQGGTGLGLAISKRIVEMMGGRIGVQSFLGQGSCFWFELRLPVAEQPVLAVGAAPRQPPNVEVFEAPSQAAAASQPLRILVAEDHETNRRLVQLMLEKLGQRPDFAANGLEAVQAWERQAYDFILMDCQMPEMDGFEATREIRRREAARPPGRRVRIIALTANALKGDRERCAAAGMDEYLSKPFMLQHLREALTLPRHPVCPPPAPGAGTAPPAAPDFAPARPAQLWAELGAEGTRGIAEDFLRDLPGTVERLEALVRTGPSAEVARLAHSLLGIGRSLGLERFCEQCRALEAAVHAGDGVLVAELAAATPGLAQKAQSALRDWISAQSEAHVANRGG